MSPLALSIRFLQTQPDSRLVALARDGHERAFEALVHRYRRQLLSYCRRLTKSEVGAEDVLQQALLQAWVALGRGEQIRDVRAWLYRIVHNVAISQLRRGIRPATVELDLIEGSGGVDSEVEQRIEAHAALAGLAALPTMQREVMLATALEGRSHDELASALGVSSGAVRGLIYRARAALRAAAAALVPAPLVNWAAREDLHGRTASSQVIEAVAGGGSAGIGGLLLKGGAIVVSAGALVGATSGSSSHHRHPAPAPRNASAVKGGGRPFRSVAVADLGSARLGTHRSARVLGLPSERRRSVLVGRLGAAESVPGASADRRDSAERSGSRSGRSGSGDRRSGSDDGGGSPESSSGSGRDDGSGGGSSGSSREGGERSGSRDGGSGSRDGETLTSGSSGSGSDSSGSASDSGDGTIAESSDGDGGGSDGGLPEGGASPGGSGGSGGASSAPTADGSGG